MSFDDKFNVNVFREIADRIEKGELDEEERSDLYDFLDKYNARRDERLRKEEEELTRFKRYFTLGWYIYTQLLGEKAE